MASFTVTNRFKYDVFLSFRGEDTRYGFTSYLKKALDDKGVRTFMDDEELQKGEEITPSLLKAIDESNMAIVVLSKNYASSSFCLQELSHILDSIKDKGRSVLPVFYKVDPSIVRKLEKSYGEAMDKHKANSNLDKWKVCLHQVADLAGFHCKKKGDMHEHKFIGEIVEKVLRNIEPVPLPVGDYKVGLEHQKQHVISLLNVGSDDTVRMVGIHGIGGIGKTTLAISVYNLIANKFEVSCFVENVRENHEKHGLPYLQNIILSKVVGEKKELTGVLNGISKLGQMLQQKKLLLILDDVNELEQLEALAGKHDWFNRSSRVIITTRDKSLLTWHGIKRTYEVKGLNDKDAAELVRRKAFKDEFSPSYNNVSIEKMHVLERVVAYACGHPLALEVMGSHFSNKTIEQCKDALDRYEKVPHKKIQTTLQLSFDALEDQEKFVFLDIACCFKGWKLTRVKEILHVHHGDNMKDHINVLVEKSLIKINEFGNVTLHDLLEDMGKEIVRQESPNDPGERSRLWDPKDIQKVLEENKGTDKIEIIHFNCWNRVKWDGEAFKRMKNLKTLIIMNADFSQKPKHLPKSLRVLECDYLNPLEWKFFLKKKFQNMKVLNLNSSKALAQIPDISGLPNLEGFSIQDCATLIAIDKSIGFLGNLKILRIVNCTKIRIIPPLMLPSLEELYLSDCSDLENFSPVIDEFGDKLKIMSVINCIKLRSIPPLKLDSLETLELSGCDTLENFPLVVDTFLAKLKTLNVKSCRNLRIIPPLKLDSLETLELSGFDTLESFPLVIGGHLGKLKTLVVGNYPRSIPPLMLPSLEELYLSYCSNLENFSHVIDEFGDKLKIMRFLHCIKLRSIPSLKLDSLETLELSDCYNLECFPSVVDKFLGKLKTLLVRRCYNLRIIPPLMLDSLETLEISDCHSLESFPLVIGGHLGKLKALVVTKCRSLRSIPPLKLDSLETLELSCCDTLESFPLVVDTFLAKLKTLNVKSCRNLRIIPPLKLDSLETLEISDCHSLESFPLVIGGHLGKLKTLVVTKCRSLGSIPPLKLDSLITLKLSDCHSLESFPLVVEEYLGKLKTMLVTNCLSLRSIPPLKLDSLETLDLSCCYSLENFPLVVDGFLGKLKTMLVKNCHNLRSIPPLKLDLLEKLDLSNCFMLESFSSVGDGLLDKLKFMNIEFCIMLRSMPQLSLTSLENFNFSCCYNLENFPEILGEMRNIPGLLLDDTLGKESPFPFHNLTQPPTFHPCDCEYDNRSYGNDPKLTIMNEEKVNAMQSSNVKYICVRNAKLSDELLSKTLMLFANVKELHLTNNQLTIIPKSIEKCQFLWNLVLDDCEELNEIKGIPPCLRELSALNCKSLSSSCKSKLLNQKLHEVGNTWFRLPRAKIPEWFDHQREAGMSISFWFCGKFPAIALCVVSPHTWNYSNHPVKVIINGITFFDTLGWKTVNRPRTYHLHLFHLQVENFNDNMDKALLENKWNHAEVDFGFPFMYSGIHVLKEKSNMKDIQFINPENDANVVFTRDEAMLPEPFNLSTELSSTSDEIEPLLNNLPLSSSSKGHFS